jgi:hypothetical protein
LTIPISYYIDDELPFITTENYKFKTYEKYISEIISRVFTMILCSAERGCGLHRRGNAMAVLHRPIGPFSLLKQSKLKGGELSIQSNSLSNMQQPLVEEFDPSEGFNRSTRKICPNASFWGHVLFVGLLAICLGCVFWFQANSPDKTLATLAVLDENNNTIALAPNFSPTTTEYVVTLNTQSNSLWLKASPNDGTVSMNVWIPNNANILPVDNMVTKIGLTELTSDSPVNFPIAAIANAQSVVDKLYLTVTSINKSQYQYIISIIRSSTSGPINGDGSDTPATPTPTPTPAPQPKRSSTGANGSNEGSQSEEGSDSATEGSSATGGSDSGTESESASGSEEASGDGS